jgi:hypothetical protein
MVDGVEFTDFEKMMAETAVKTGSLVDVYSTAVNSAAAVAAAMSISRSAVLARLQPELAARFAKYPTRERSAFQRRRLPAIAQRQQQQRQQQRCPLRKPFIISSLVSETGDPITTILHDRSFESSSDDDA